VIHYTHFVSFKVS